MTAQSTRLRCMVSVVALTCASSFSFGCGGIFEQKIVRSHRSGLEASPANGHDEQACVERTLRAGANPGDVGQAVAHFRGACAEGDAAACSALGVMHELGRGMPRDVPRAQELFEGACAASNGRACLNLADLVAGRAEASAGAPRASLLRAQACHLGVAEACFRLGERERDRAGANASASARRAVGWFELACDGGHPEACTALARLAERGKGTLQDLTRAVQLYERACARGDEPACGDMTRINELRPGARADVGPELALGLLP